MQPFLILFIISVKEISLHNKLYGMNVMFRLTTVYLVLTTPQYLFFQTTIGICSEVGNLPLWVLQNFLWLCTFDQEGIKISSHGDLGKTENYNEGCKIGPSPPLLPHPLCEYIFSLDNFRDFSSQWVTVG